METGLEGRAVLVTEAMCNHGRASALAFAREGANLLLCTPAAPNRTKTKSLWRPISSNLSSYAGGDSRFGIPSVSPLFASWPQASTSRLISGA